MNLTPSQVKSQGLPANPRTALLEKIKAIMFNGEEIMPLTKEQLKKVRHLVYWCSGCKGYHFWEGKDFEDVEAVLGIEVSNKSRYTGAPK